MKKILKIFASNLLIASSSLAVISCVNDYTSSLNKPTEFGPFADTELNKLPIQEREMVVNTSLVTKIILLSRHENLNYNVNEMLSSFLTPDAATANTPTTYTIAGDDGKTYLIDISKYLKGFESMNPINNQNTLYYSNSFGVYASYVMGMYDDDVYLKFIDSLYKSDGTAAIFGDTSDKNGLFTKPHGYNQGQNPELKLSNDEDRRQLAWGIQDTGALTNYLLLKGYNGDNPGGPWGPGDDPNGPTKKIRETNIGSYMFSNGRLASVTYNGSPGTVVRFDPNSKLKGVRIDNQTSSSNKTDIKLRLFDQNNKNVIEQYAEDNPFYSENPYLNTDYFGSMQSYLAAKTQSLNIPSKTSRFASLLKNFGENPTGASIIMEFIDAFMPIMAGKDQYSTEPYILTLATIESLFDGVIGMMNTPQYENKFNFDKQKVNELYAEWSKALTESKIVGDGSGSGSNWSNITSALMTPPLTVPITNLVGKNERTGQEYDGMKAYSDLIDLLYKAMPTRDEQQEFVSILFGNKLTANYPWMLKVKFNLIRLFMSEFYDAIFSPDSDFSENVNFLSIYKLLARSLNAIDASHDVIKRIQDKYKGSGWGGLTASEKADVIRSLGFVNNHFTKDSVLYVFNQSVNDHNDQASIDISKTFFTPDAPFQVFIKKAMEDFHNNYLQYILKDNYWNFDTNSVKLTGSADQIGATLSYTVDYNGYGDPTVKKYTKKTEVSRDFNPYQSGPDAKPLVKLDNDLDYIMYDGLGNLQDIQNNEVHHRYEIEWKNISRTVNEPYWVITKIRCFDMSNPNSPVEFYNLY